VSSETTPIGTVIPAMAEGWETTGDSTLRLHILIDAAMAADAVELFGATGTAIAMKVLGRPEDEAIEGATYRARGKSNMTLLVDVPPYRDSEGRLLTKRAMQQFFRPPSGMSGKPEKVLLALAAIKPEHLRRRQQEQDQRLEARGLRLTALAVQWCRASDFQQWLREAPEMRASVEAACDGQPVLTAEDLAARAMRHAAGVDSRSQLDTDPDARSRFLRNVRDPFMRWKERRPDTEEA
jgi:hypothetical protein